MGFRCTDLGSFSDRDDVCVERGVILPLHDRLSEGAPAEVYVKNIFLALFLGGSTAGALSNSFLVISVSCNGGDAISNINLSPTLYSSTQEKVPICI